MHTHRLPAIALLALASLTAVHAAEGSSTSGIMVYAVGGTGGIGGGVGYHFNDVCTVRGEIANYSYNDKVDQDGIQYSGDLKLATKAVYVDVHPFSGAFRLTVGLDNGRTEFGGAAVGSGGSIDVNGTTYTYGPGDSITAAVRYPSTMPYVGIGWGLNGGGFNLGLDLGVNIGSPDLVMTRSASLGAIPGFDANFDAQRSKYASDVADVNVFPIIKISVGYSF
ncbi:MAG TPA: hypothetical protein DCY41_05145 [Opitutae bacterium]|nr:hypothetical protein [Opitutae bacterium]